MKEKVVRGANVRYALRSVFLRRAIGNIYSARRYTFLRKLREQQAGAQKA